MPNMSPQELELAKQLCDKDPEFKQLWDEHHKLKEELAGYKEKKFLTQEDELEMKRLKQLKLQGKDRIFQKISDYKVEVVSSG